MSMQSVLGLGVRGNQKAERDVAEMTQKIDKAVNHLQDLPKRVGHGSERVKITPELAQHYLTFNRNNWDVIPARIEGYADEMRRGEWKENGSTIVFSKSARLIDGQHRLQAILKAGVSIFMLVVYGCDEDSQVTIDVGRTKKAKGVMVVEGLPTWEAGVAGTALHTIINHANGLPLSSNVRRNNREIQNYYLEFPAVKASVTAVSELPRKGVLITHSKALVLHYLFAQKDVPAADEFMQRLFLGDSLARSSPIYQLRQKLNEARIGGKRYSLREEYHACIKTWNAVRARKSMSSARSLFPSSDEPLPEIE